MSSWIDPVRLLRKWCCSICEAQLQRQQQSVAWEWAKALKKKKGEKKSKLPKVPEALCVFWSAVSDNTLRWTHTCRNKAAEEPDRTTRHPHIHNVIFASWLAMSHSRGSESLPKGTAGNQNGLVWLVRHLMLGEVVLRVYPKRSLSSIPAPLSFVQKNCGIYCHLRFLPVTQLSQAQSWPPAFHLVLSFSLSSPFISHSLSFQVKILYFLG